MATHHLIYCIISLYFMFKIKQKLSSKEVSPTPKDTEELKKTFQKEKEDMEKKISSLKKERNDVRQKLEQTIHEKEKEIERLRLNESNLKMELKKYREQNEQLLESESTSLHTEKEAIKTMERLSVKERADLRQDVESKQQTILQLRDELQTVRVRLDEVQRQKEDMKQKLEHCRQQEDHHRHSAQAAHQQLSSLRTQLDTASADLKDKAKREADLKDMLDASNRRISSLQSQLATSNKEGERMTSERDHAVQENATLKHEKNMLADSKISLEREVVDLKQKLVSVEAAAATREQTQKEWREQDARRHKEELQTQMTMMERLGQARGEELDSMRRAVQEMARTNNTTTKVLNTVYRDYKGDFKK